MDQYKQQFGFVLNDRKIFIDDIRVRGIGKSTVSRAHFSNTSSSKLEPSYYTSTYFEGGRQKTGIYHIKSNSQILLNKLTYLIIKNENI